jgi:excisionase family DNA binding protein
MSDTKSLTVRQAALKLGNTQKFVRDLLYEGKLPGAYKAGRAWHIPAAAIEQRLKEREALNG